MSELAEFWVHTVTVETYTGTTGSGAPGYAAPQTVNVFTEGKRRFVRGVDGQQVVSETTVYGDPSLAAQFKPGSRVTLPDRATPTTVLTLDVNDSQGLDLPDHVAVFLQ